MYEAVLHTVATSSSVPLAHVCWVLKGLILGDVGLVQYLLRCSTWCCYGGVNCREILCILCMWAQNDALIIKSQCKARRLCYSYCGEEEEGKNCGA